MPVMPQKRMKKPARLGVPNPRRVVPAGGGDLLASGEYAAEVM